MLIFTETENELRIALREVVSTPRVKNINNVFVEGSVGESEDTNAERNNNNVVTLNQISITIDENSAIIFEEDDTLNFGG